MDEYLEQTQLCDSDDGEIRKKAQEIVKDARTPKEAAVKIFYFVRDEIAYALDVYCVKASHTLRKGSGPLFSETHSPRPVARFRDSSQIPAR